MQLLRELFGNGENKGWLVSLALCLGAYAVAALLTVGMESRDWWIPFHAITAVGIAIMGFLRERNIGSGLTTFVAAFYSASWIWVWSYLPSHQAPPLMVSIGLSALYVAAPFIGFCASRAIRRMRRSENRRSE